jgi:carbohydrate diacid regulator
MDLNGHMVVTTQQVEEDVKENVVLFADSMADSQVIDGYQYFKVFDDKRLEYVLLVHSLNESAYTTGMLAVLQLQNLLVAYKERFDKENFVKNLLLDNLLLVDIYNRAKKLHINVEARRIAFLIESGQDKEQNLMEIMKHMDLVEDSDFITAVDEKSVVYITEIKEDEGQSHFIEQAQAIRSQLDEDGIPNVKIAIGNIASNIKDVSRSYKEAQIALEVSKIFYEDAQVIAYNQLGIGRLIYQLPLPLCKMFIREVFGDYSPESIDAETLRNDQQVL